MSDNQPGADTYSPAQGVGVSAPAAESTTDFKPLLEAANPQVYRHNAFRTLGVSSYASERDIRRQLEKIKVIEKRGSNASQALRLLPLNEAPSSYAVREAMQRLSNPESRFIDELFWLW